MSKIFKPTTLYIKTHNKTGLKYFGKTTGNPFIYLGSGKYWKRHLAKHGNDIATEILGHFVDKEECIAAAKEFSNKNNIVTAVNENKKKIWANEIIENGTDGGLTRYGPRSIEAKANMSRAQRSRIKTPAELEQCSRNLSRARKRRKGEWSPSLEARKKLRDANLGKKVSEETKKKMSESLKGHTVTQETRNKISKANSGKIVSDSTKEKLRTVVRTQEQKDHLRKLNLGKKVTNETKLKLSGYVVSINKQGQLSRIPKDQYYTQSGPKNDWEWVSHKSKEAVSRKQPVFSAEEATDSAKMRR